MLGISNGTNVVDGEQLVCAQSGALARYLPRLSCPWVLVPQGTIVGGLLVRLTTILTEATILDFHH